MASLVPGETLRVLLVSVSESVRDEVGAALAGPAGDQRLYWVSQPALAPVRAGDLLPHVVLVDDQLGGASTVALIGQIAARVPQAAVLALVDPADIAAARRAVLAGARAFVIKPVQPEELIAALRHVLAARATAYEAEPGSAPAGRIIAFCAPKGGTGRSTLAINTAVSIRKLSGGAVVLVDADFLAPALDVALNLDASRTIADLLPRLATLDTDLVTSMLAAHASGIRVLLAPPPADLSQSISLPQVQQMLAWLKRMFPWVVVDLGLPLNDTAYAFLDGADRIVMSVLPEMVGLRNARLMLDQLEAHGYPGEKVWMALNRSSMRNGVPVHDIEGRLRVRIRFQIPDDQPLATHSINRGVPIAISHEGSAVAKAIRGLARELVAEAETEAAPAAEDRVPRLALRGLFGRA